MTCLNPNMENTEQSEFLPIKKKSMVQANELRIGNWLRPKGRDYPVQTESDDMRPSVLINYEPIPLTAEILEKAGFMETDAWLNNYIKSGVYIVYDNGFYLSELGSKIYNEITYLHQLQNLYFALCGQELEINLNNGR